MTDPVIGASLIKNNSIFNYLPKKSKQLVLQEELLLKCLVCYTVRCNHYACVCSN